MSYGEKKDQKSFKKVHPKVMTAWAQFLTRRATNDQAAGPIALFLATTLTPTQWSELVEKYWEFLGETPPINADARPVPKPDGKPQPRVRSKRAGGDQR